MSLKWGPLTWRHLDVAGATELWAELIDWVEWLRHRYGLPNSTLPACWPNHPVAVEELTALMGGYTSAYQQLTTKDKSVVRYHDMMIVWHRLELWSCLDRIREHASIHECTGERCGWKPPRVKPLNPCAEETVAHDLDGRRIDPGCSELAESVMTRLVEQGRAVDDDDGILFNGQIWTFDTASRRFRRDGSEVQSLDLSST